MMGARVADGVSKGGTGDDESGGQMRLMARAFSRMLSVLWLKRLVIFCVSECGVCWKTPLEGSTGAIEGDSSGPKLFVWRKSMLGSLPWPNEVVYKLCWRSDALEGDAKFEGFGEALSFRLFEEHDSLGVPAVLSS